MLEILFCIVIVAVVVWLQGFWFVFIIGLPCTIIGLFEAFDIKLSSFLFKSENRYLIEYDKIKELTGLEVANINRDTCFLAVATMLKHKETDNNIAKIVLKIRLEVCIEQKGYVVPILKVAKQYKLVDEIYDPRIKFIEAIRLIISPNKSIISMLYMIILSAYFYFIKNDIMVVMMASGIIIFIIFICPIFILIYDRILEYKIRI